MADRRDYTALISLVESLLNNVSVSQSLLSDIVTQQREVSSTMLRILDANRNIQASIVSLVQDHKSILSSIQPALSDLEHSLDTLSESVSSLDTEVGDLEKSINRGEREGLGRISVEIRNLESRIVNAVVLRISVVLLGMTGLLEVIYQVIRWVEDISRH
jgi:peptidoglycan hydrolase CwlO-like protein